MNSKPWAREARTSWSCLDVADAWSALINVHFRGRNLFEEAAAHTQKLAGNDQFLISAAMVVNPEFAALCKVPADGLEAMRAMLDRESLVWCYLTAALAWHETTLEGMPRNAPTKLP